MTPLRRETRRVFTTKQKQGLWKRLLKNIY